MTNSKPSYGILRYHQQRNGRSYYQAREVGSVTCLRAQVWSTPDRAAAEKLAAEVGGTVVDVNAR